MVTPIIAAGWLVWLLVGHFIGDWLLQPDWMAKAKTSDPTTRAIHSFIWQVCVVLMFVFWLPPLTSKLACVLVGLWLFGTHFWIDSYRPLMWFRKHVSGDPAAASVETFKADFGTPRGFMVNVTIDQIFHLLTLVPVAWWLAVTIK